VAILLNNEARFPAAMLGVLAAGRAYIPLDAGEPIARNGLIAEQAGAAALISAGDLADQARSLFPADVTAFPEVIDAAVVVRSDADGIARSLAAFVVLGPDVQGLLPRHLAAMLQKRLPRYLVPWPIFVVNDLPRLPSLKLDRPQLMQMSAIRAEKDSAGVENGVASAVTEVFEQILEVSGATPDDNIASLGGDSLQAVYIAAELERRFGVVISDEIVALTIQDLALWIADQPRPVIP
jgi:acyl carrier protein